MLSSIEDVRFEKIDGIIYDMSPSGTYNHASVNFNISRLIANQLKDNICKVFSENFDYRYNPETDDYVTPDVMIVCDRKKIKFNAYFGVAKFIVETLSPSSIIKDRSIKMKIYEKAGVEEYWIVEPNSCTIEDYVLQNGKYNLVKTWTYDRNMDENDNYEEDVVLSSMPHIKMKLTDIFTY